jgi:uncharacterized protein YfiM (DUF2279 family)
MKGGKQGLRFKVEGLRLGLLFFSLLNLGFVSFSQDTVLVDNGDVNVYDTIKNRIGTFSMCSGVPIGTYDKIKPNKKRIRLMTLANVAGYSLATYGFYNAWYKNQPTTSFHFFNDNAEWLQVDKAGHVYGAYIGSRASMELWRWTGISRNKRIWLGGLSGLAFQTIIETFDGFGKDWGWSWGDVGANAFGSGLLMGQEFLWNEQRIDVKFSFHRRNYNEPMLSERADSLYGTSILNRMVKDYNGQTYWLSANIKSFFPKANVPSWLNIAVGYGAEGMFEGRKNIWKDRNGNTIDRTDIDRYRQWYIAPDINLTKIKTKSKILKTVLFFFNSFKFPLPSIGFSKKGIEWNWIHF